MDNNKKLHISSGGSRRATLWQRQELMWSEFVDKLKNPDRSPETIQEYLAYPKSKQDEIKDVGGFVGGVFTGDRRKAQRVEGRDLITLDMDNIPSGQTDDILKRVHGLGCASVVYSKRKHTQYAPRLRVIIPSSRTLTADEYEPVARKLAQLIGIEFCDPTTFEASRLMYWPSVSVDSTYVCEMYDNPFCNADGILNAYGDWHDIAQWPRSEERRVGKEC